MINRNITKKEEAADNCHLKVSADSDAGAPLMLLAELGRNFIPASRVALFNQSGIERVF